MASSDDHPVVIVGGGPVGMALALDLSLRGVGSLVVERRIQPQPIPKGQNLTQRTLEHFDFWGVEEQIRAARVMPEGYPNSGVTAYRDLSGAWSYPWWRRSAVGEYYNRSNDRIPQYETERVLRQRVSGLDNIRVLYGWEARTVSGGHAVHVVDCDSGAERTIEARFLVGCDGSHSVVREAVGIQQKLSDHDRRMVLLVFRSADLNRLLERFGEASFFNIQDPALDGYWRFLGRVDATGQFFFHCPLPAGAAEDEFDFHGLLEESIGEAFAVDFDYIGFWDLRFAIADRYRRADVFVAGDAAHSHPPYGGYGINTGFEDARNLGWKLAARLEGWGSEGLLDSYDAERRPVFESTAVDFIEKMIERGRAFLRLHDPGRDLADFAAAWEKRRLEETTGVSGFEPHYEGSPLIGGTGQPGAVGEHTFVARPGHHLAPRGGIIDRLGADFTVVALDASGDGLVAASRELGVPIDLVAAPRRGDVSDYGARLILVRPDHFVAWAGDLAGLPEAREILRRATAK